MKLVAIPLLTVLAVGCAKSEFTGSSDGHMLHNLAKMCVKDRQRAIREEWHQYERRAQRRVVFPDWRAQAVRWARVECDSGRAIAQFRP